uniref:Orf26 n=1 Tax=Clostridioides difficile TaxID=1496 RepID=Q84F46_CLODI|nr:Orf26 [Clostridioides difficile]
MYPVIRVSVTGIFYAFLAFEWRKIT